MTAQSTAASPPRRVADQDENAQIAARLRLARQEAGLFRDEVAGQLGWPAGHLAALETGCRLPLLSEVISLARIFGVDVEFFRPDAPIGATMPPAPLAAIRGIARRSRPSPLLSLPEAA